MHNSWLTILKALQGTEYQDPEKQGFDIKTQTSIRAEGRNQCTKTGTNTRILHTLGNRS